MTREKCVQMLVYNKPEEYRNAVYYVQIREKSRIAFVSYDKALSFAETVALQSEEVLLLCVPLGEEDEKPVCLVAFR